MARSARLINRTRIDVLKKQLRDRHYISFAVQTIAYCLTNQYFKEMWDKKVR